MSSVAFASGQEEDSYIRQQAQALGLDDQAVLSVAKHEGVTLPAEVGDSGTSFGPWQLHAGGALPASIWALGPQQADAWANSPAGIDYALEGIKKAVGSATHGLAEISAQVTNFERPANPQAEILASDATYLASGGTASAVASGLSTTGTQQQPGTAGAAGSQTGAIDTSLSSTVGGAVGGAFDNLFKDLEPWIIRGFAVAIGAGLVGLSLVGIYLALTKSGPGKAAGTILAPAKDAVAAVTPSRATAPAPSKPPVRKRVGFDGPAAGRGRRAVRPKRGQPGSARLAKGDTIPF